MSSPQTPPPPSPLSPHQVRHSIPMLFPVFIIFFLFVCFLSIFLFQDLFHCLRARRNSSAQPTNAAVGRVGLDPGIISSFPRLPYSAVKGLQEGKCGAECVVCLSEFGEGDVIRLVTVCCHAFHPTCIDSWLASHRTCPVCRSDLEGPPDEAAVMAVREVVGVGDDHVINVDDDGFKGNAVEGVDELRRGRVAEQR